MLATSVADGFGGKEHDWMLDNHLDRTARVEANILTSRKSGNP
jgi:hypothetical protein